MNPRQGRWTTLVAALAVVLALAVSACGSSDDDSSSASSGDTTASSSSGTETTSTSSSESEGGTSDVAGKKLGLAMDVLRNDKSFGEATYNGARQAADDMGLDLTVVDSLGNDPKKAQAALQNLARDNDMVINGAVALMSSMPRIAQQYPDKQFSVYAVATRSGENLHWAYQDWYPLAYLAGIVAAHSTRSRVIGFVGGGEIPPTIAGEQAFKDAIRSVDPSIRVLSTITGDFNDPARGKDATSAQIAQGADIVYSFLDAAHEGAVAAAEEAGDVKLMSVIVPKCDISQGVELGDTVANQQQLTYNLVRRMAEGSLDDTVYGIQDPRVATFAFCRGEGSPEVTKAVEAARAKFVSGELRTPPDLQASQGEGD